eukprot:GEMP01101650.1.p1 GENE.GEMP01101650.1~~GEMP01101650.1.p1  ORF type:complete len:103 (-),score=0.58 GEMP01101650.1:27-335(-)
MDIYVRVFLSGTQAAIRKIMRHPPSRVCPNYYGDGDRASPADFYRKKLRHASLNRAIRSCYFLRFLYVLPLLSKIANFYTAVVSSRAFSWLRLLVSATFRSV